MKKTLLLILTAWMILAACKKEEIPAPMPDPLPNDKETTCCDSAAAAGNTSSFAVTNSSSEAKTFRIYGGGTGLDAVDDNTDPAFSFGTGFDNIVRRIAFQSDKKIIVGGNFTAYNGTSSSRIIRLNEDGSVDPTFDIGTGFDNNVLFFQIQSDGKVIVGGTFTTYNGTTANRIIRLNSDGSIDASFVYGTGFNSDVHSIIVQSDNKVVIGGSFTSYNGTTANQIIRLDSDGSIDGTFDYGFGFSALSTVYTLAAQSDGKILAGGNFTTYDGLGANKIIRIESDGSVDGTFSYGTGFNDDVNTIAVQSDGKILAGGVFTSYKGTTANRIVRLTTLGAIDATFVNGTGFSGSVFYFNIESSDGSIILGGTFTSYNGTSANYIIKLNSDGSIASSFDYGAGFNSPVYSVVFQSNGKIVVGGIFTSYDGTDANRIIRLESTGAVNDTDSDFVIIATNGGVTTLDQINAGSAVDPMCICKVSVSATNKTTFGNPLQKKEKTSTGTTTSEDISLLARYDANFSQNQVVVNGKDFKTCTLDGFNYLQWVVPGGEQVTISIDYCQPERANSLRSAAPIEKEKVKKKKYTHASFKF